MLPGRLYGVFAGTNLITFAVLGSAVGAFTGLFASFLFRLGVQVPSILKSAFWGAVGYLVGFAGCVVVPFPRNTITERWPNGTIYRARWAAISTRTESALWSPSFWRCSTGCTGGSGFQAPGSERSSHESEFSGSMGRGRVQKSAMAKIPSRKDSQVFTIVLCQHRFLLLGEKHTLPPRPEHAQFLHMRRQSCPNEEIEPNSAQVDPVPVIGRPLGTGWRSNDCDQPIVLIRNLDYHCSVLGKRPGAKEELSNLFLIGRSQADRRNRVVSILPGVRCGFPENTQAHVPNLLDHRILGLG